MDLQKIRKTRKVGPKKDVELYGLKWVNYGNLSSSALISEIEQLGTLSDSDAELIVRTFVDVITSYVANGHSVDLGVMGTIKPKITAKSVDTEAQCKASTIEGIGILYRSRQELIDDAKKMSMRVISTSSSKSGSADLPEGGDDEPGDDNTDTGGNTGGGGGGFAG